jgi:hypothetical protein
MYVNGLQEMWMDERRRKPMSPHEMALFYSGAKAQPEHAQRGLVAMIGESIAALKQRLHGEMPAQPVEPAYRRI